MDIEKVHFNKHVLLPGNTNGRVTTVFARDVDKIELMAAPNGVRITRGKRASFFFERNIEAVDYLETEVEVQPAAKPKAGKPGVSLTFEET